MRRILYALAVRDVRAQGFIGATLAAQIEALGLCPGSLEEHIKHSL